MTEDSNKFFGVDVSKIATNVVSTLLIIVIAGGGTIIWSQLWGGVNAVDDKIATERARTDALVHVTQESLNKLQHTVDKLVHHHNDDVDANPLEFNKDEKKIDCPDINTTIHEALQQRIQTK